jgi:ABC-type lipoprotein release transport system permease subunit
MANPSDELKALLSTELQGTIATLWNSEQDKKFLQYNAEKIAKYVVKLKDPDATVADKQEAQFNLNMLQTSVAAYAFQKAKAAEHGVEETAKHVVAFLIGVLIKMV